MQHTKTCRYGNFAEALSIERFCARSPARKRPIPGASPVNVRLAKTGIFRADEKTDLDRIRLL